MHEIQPWEHTCSNSPQRYVFRSGLRTARINQTPCMPNCSMREPSREQYRTARIEEIEDAITSMGTNHSTCNITVCQKTHECKWLKSAQRAVHESPKMLWLFMGIESSVPLNLSWEHTNVGQSHAGQSHGSGSSTLPRIQDISAEYRQRNFMHTQIKYKRACWHNDEAKSTNVPLQIIMLTGKQSISTHAQPTAQYLPRGPVATRQT